MASGAEFADVIAYLEVGAGAPKLNDDRVKVYADLLADLPGDVLLAAAKRALLEHGYATVPPPGVIRRHAQAMVEGPGHTAGEAWRLVLAAVRRHTVRGECEGLAALPPRVAAAARAYGWRSLCDVRPGEQQTAFAQFRDVYQAIDSRERAEAALPPALRAGRPAELTQGIGAMPALT